MATKIKKNESIIEKYRDNGNWIKILEVCKQINTKENGYILVFKMYLSKLLLYHKFNKYI